jgi:hypothetical protein
LLLHKQDFGIFDKLEKQLTIHSILDTNTHNFNIQKGESLAVSKIYSYRYQQHYHNYKLIEKNNNNEQNQEINLLAFAGLEQIVYEGSKVF